MDTSFLSETVMIKCRVSRCQMSLLRKNYKDHLRSKHPKENCLDLTPFGQAKISNFFSPQVQPAPVVPPDKQLTVVPAVHDQVHHGESDHVTEEQSDAGGGLLGKRRHSSEESGFNEDFEPLDTPSTKKLHMETEKEETKLDLILSEIMGLRSDLNVGNNLKGSEQQVNEIVDEVDDSDETEVEKLLLHARSVEDLSKVGFKYDGNSFMSCSVCEMSESAGFSGTFAYDKKYGLEFEDEYLLPQEFRNLKKSLKRHLKQSRSHTDSVKSELEKEKAALTLLSKNQVAGMNLGFICMKNYI